MSDIEIFVLKTLVVKKPRIKLSLKFRCSVGGFGRDTPWLHGNPTVAALVSYSKDGQSATPTHHAITNPCFVVTQPLEPGSLASGLFDVVVEVSRQADSHSRIHEWGPRRTAVHDMIAWSVAAHPILESDPPQATQVSYHTSEPGTRPPDQQWLEEVVFAESGIAKITLHNDRLATYRTGAHVWHFAIDGSVPRKFRVIPTVSFEPNHLFWCSFLYHRHLRRFDPGIHYLESFVSCTWTAFGAELAARKSQVQFLLSHRTTNQAFFAGWSADFIRWGTSVCTTVVAGVIDPVTSMLSAVIAGLPDDHHRLPYLRTLSRQLRDMLQETAHQPTMSVESFSTLKQQLSQLLSQRSRWLLLCVLKALQHQRPDALDEVWVAMADKCPEVLSHEMHGRVTDSEGAGLRAHTLLKLVRTILRKRTAEPASQPMQHNRPAQQAAKSLHQSVVFDVDGRVQAMRWSRLAASTPLEQFMVWEGNLVLVTEGRILVRPAATADRPWNTRMASRSKVQSFSVARHELWDGKDWTPFLADPDSLAFAGKNREGEGCLIRRAYRSPHVFFHYVQLNLLKDRIKDRCSRLEPERNLGLIYGNDGVLRSIYSGASGNFGSVHFINRSSWPGSRFVFEAQFIVQSDDRSFFPFLNLQDQGGLRTQRRIACPVPVDLLVPVEKRYRTNFNSWVRMLVVQTDPSDPKLFQVYTHVQSVELTEPDADGSCDLITKANIIECYSRKDNPYDLNFESVFDYTLSTVRIPHPRSGKGSVVFDPEDPQWLHWFVWRRLTTRVVGIRLKPTGEFLVFSNPQNTFRLVGHSRLSLPMGALHFVRPAMCESTTGVYWAKTVLTADASRQCKLYELLVRS